MYSFQDYFDKLNANRPYSAAGEELEDYLRLLDMLLESYLEYKGMGSESKLFSRGLVVTESEMTGYFSMPPYFRERDICDPVLSAAADAAFEYIEKRTRATKAALTSWAGDEDDRDKTLENDLLRIDRLRNIFDLNRTEVLAVLLALAAEIDRRYERIYGYLQDNISKTTPTTGLLYALMGRITPRDGAEELIPRPLDERMYIYFFIRKEEQDSLQNSLILQPLMKRTLLGIPDPETNRAGVFHLYSEEENIPVFFEEPAKELDFILSRENQDTGKEESELRAIYLGNQDEETVQHVVSHYCSEHDERLYILDLQQMQDMQQEALQISLSELSLRLKLNNGRLAIRYLPDSQADLSHPDEKITKLKVFLKNIGKVCEPKHFILFGQKEEPGELTAMYVPVLRVPDASVALREEIWQCLLKTQSGIRIMEDVNIPDLADCYEIPYGKIHQAVGHAIATALTKPEPVISRQLILESLRQLNQVDFSGLATYVNPAYTWADITISDSQKALMKTACDRYRLRNRVGEGWGLKRKNAYGNGVSILLYGPPGTGKTMAAQVIANELALPLYRVDISQISSKYIGETEKNLAVIFTAAVKANVILFFDEADSLFTKRTDVSDSHDKYANSETSYLLQKIEEYDGMSILATNYYNNFDDAFVRRITYAIRMDSPDKETRYTLWTTILPETAEMTPDIDFRFFADKFELSGSNIKSILFNAAYMAGAQKKPIGAEHIVRSMEYEFNKLGKLVNGSDFGKYDVYLQSYVPQKTTPERPARKLRNKN